MAESGFQAKNCPGRPIAAPRAARRRILLFSRPGVAYNADTPAPLSLTAEGRRNLDIAPVLQAKCPHCHNVLRIPSDWLDKPMRCKFCNNTFQARAKAGAAQPVNGTATSVQAKPTGVTTAPAVPRKAVGDPFSFDEDDDAQA